MSAADKLNQVEEAAALQFLPEQIAIIVGIDSDELVAEISAKTGPLYLAYERGHLMAEAEVRKSILQMAKQGSTPAQKQMLDLIEKNRAKPPKSPPPPSARKPFEMDVEI